MKHNILFLLTLLAIANTAHGTSKQAGKVLAATFGGGVTAIASNEFLNTPHGEKTPFFGVKLTPFEQFILRDNNPVHIAPHNNPVRIGPLIVLGGSSYYAKNTEFQHAMRDHIGQTDRCCAGIPGAIAVGAPQSYFSGNPRILLLKAAMIGFGTTRTAQIFAERTKTVNNRR